MPTKELGLRLNVFYLAFSGDHDREAARRAFVKRFGREPAEIVTTAWLIYLGPIPATAHEPTDFDIARVTLAGPVPDPEPTPPAGGLTP